MKRNVCLMFAMAAVLLATSCKKEPVESSMGNEARITFNLETEGMSRTKEISDGKGANRLVYAVFDENGQRISTIGKVDKVLVDGFPTTENITLAKGQTYKVAFWAQNSETSAYLLDNDMNLTIDYTRCENNAEERDAFFKTETFTVTGDENIDVVLKRPFAQINVGVTDADWNDAIASGIEIETSKVVIKNAAANMNLLDGSVSNETEVTYDFGVTPKSNNEVLSVDLDGDGTAESYNYLSMSYILVFNEIDGAQSAVLQDLDFTFHPTSGNDIVFGEGLNNVPVQRNWRTNIIGQILTGNIEFNISIDPIYDGEWNNGTPYPVLLKNVYYKTIADALAVAVDGDVINIANGTYNLGNSLTKSVKFVGASKTATKITYNNVNMSGVSATFENLTLITPNAIYKGFTHAGEVVFNGCVFEGLYFCYSPEFEFKDCVFNVEGDQYNVWTYGSNSTFTGCAFNCDAKAVLVYNESETTDDVVTFEDCTFNDNGGVNKQKAAIETGANHATVKHTINIKNCTVNGFSETDQDETTLHGGDSYGTNVWGNKNLMTRDNLNVFIDGTEVY